MGQVPPASDAEILDGCNASSSSRICSSLLAAQAFTIMALLIMTAAVVVTALNRFPTMIACVLYTVSGLFGMIGWTVYYAGVHNSSEIVAFIKEYQGTGGITIGYSQALCIAAWTLTLVLAGLTLVVLGFERRTLCPALSSPK